LLLSKKFFSFEGLPLHLRVSLGFLACLLWIIHAFSSRDKPYLPMWRYVVPFLMYFLHKKNEIVFHKKQIGIYNLFVDNVQSGQNILLWRG